MDVIWIDVPTSGGAFSPDDLSDLRCWYVAESIGIADGAAVGTWADQSGNAFDLTQATAANKPTYQTADLNGLATVEFDGSNDYMTSGISAGMSPSTGQWTTFAVFNTDTIAGDGIIINSDETTGAPRASQYMRVTGAGFQSVPNAMVNEYAGVTLSASTWYVGEVVRNATHCEAFVDGSSDGATAIGTPGGEDDPFYVSFHPAASVYFDGRIAEIIGYSRALTSGERTQVRDYLNDKYGL